MEFNNKVTNKFRYLSLFLAAGGYLCLFMTMWAFASYYSLIQDYFSVSNTQMGFLSVITGGLMCICWPVGGMIVDKFSMKTNYLVCMLYSVIALTILAFTKSFTVYLIIVSLSCVMMGIYYTLYAKMIKGVSTPMTEGQNTGFFQALYSILGTVTGFLGAYLVSKNGINGWKPLMLTYVIIAIIMGINCIFLLKEDQFNDWSSESGEGEDGGSSFQFKHVGKVLKMPELWLASLVYFTMLTICIAGVYAVNMMKSVYAVPLFVVTAMGVFRQYFGRVLIAVPTGKLIDKIGSFKVIRIFLIMSLVAIALFFIFPISPKYFWVIVVLVVACTIAYSMQSLCWFTPISEIDIPYAYHGTAVGIYNAIGCLNDLYIYTLCGHLVDKYGDITGNRYVFAYIAVLLVISFILCVILSKKIKKRKENEKEILV